MFRIALTLVLCVLLPAISLAQAMQPTAVPGKAATLDTPYVKTYVVQMPEPDVWTDRFINFVIGITGVIAGALLSYYYTLQKGKQDTTFELYHEFNSIEMSKIRHDAWELIKRSPDANMGEILKLHPNDGNLLLIVSRFYQKLYFNMDCKRVSEKLIFELFGDIFYLWYYGFFEDKLVPLEWQNGNNLKKLALKLRVKLPPAEHEQLAMRKKQQASSEFHPSPPEAGLTN